MVIELNAGERGVLMIGLMGGRGELTGVVIGLIAGERGGLLIGLVGGGSELAGEVVGFCGYCDRDDLLAGHQRALMFLMM